MSQKCDGCGEEPPPEVRFQQQPIPFRPTKTLCPLCYQKLEERFLRGVLLINLAMGLLGLVFLWQNPRSEMGHILVNLGFLAMFALSAIVPHELAHACVGRLMGLKVAEVWIGRGADLLITRVFGFPLRFKALPVGGLAFLQHTTHVQLRVRYFLAVLAGPIVNLLLAAAIWPVVDWHQWNLETRFCAGHVFVIAQLLVVLENLLPYRLQTSYGSLPSDGLSLVQLLFHRSPDVLSRPFYWLPERKSTWTSG